MQVTNILGTFKTGSNQLFKTNVLSLVKKNLRGNHHAYRRVRTLYNFVRSLKLIENLG